MKHFSLSSYIISLFTLLLFCRSTLTSSWWFCWKCWWPLLSSCQLALRRIAAVTGRCVCMNDWLLLFPHSPPLAFSLPFSSPLNSSQSFHPSSSQWHMTDLWLYRLQSSQQGSLRPILWVIYSVFVYMMLLYHSCLSVHQSVTNVSGRWLKWLWGFLLYLEALLPWTWTLCYQAPTYLWHFSGFLWLWVLRQTILHYEKTGQNDN